MLVLPLDRVSTKLEARVSHESLSRWLGANSFDFSSKKKKEYREKMALVAQEVSDGMCMLFPTLYVDWKTVHCKKLLILFSFYPC